MKDRELIDHKCSDLNDKLSITVLDGPGAGNASHQYLIKIPGQIVDREWHIKFQDGPVIFGINGLSDESLLAIVLDRLRGFQSGEYSCRENAIALTKLEEALHWLQHRTRDRQRRGARGLMRNE